MFLRRLDLGLGFSRPVVFKGNSVVFVCARHGVTVASVFGLSDLYEGPRVVGFKGFVRRTERLSVFNVNLLHTYSKLLNRTGLIKSYSYTRTEEENIKLFEMVGHARSYCTESSDYYINTAKVSGCLVPGFLPTVGGTVCGRRLPPSKGSGRVSRSDRSVTERLNAPKTPCRFVYTYTNFAIGDLFLPPRPRTTGERILRDRPIWPDFYCTTDSISFAIVFHSQGRHL